MIYFEVAWWVPKVKAPSIGSIINFSNFSLVNAPSESLRGNITYMTGDTKWESRIATEAAVITKPVTVQQGESLETGIDGEINLTFDKAAWIYMAPDTSLGVVQTLPADLVFSQNNGSVEYKKLAALPLTVRVLHLLIENGGDIKVSIDKDLPVITTEIVSGSATFAYNDINNTSQVLTLKTGQKFVFNDDTRQAVTE